MTRKEKLRMGCVIFLIIVSFVIAVPGGMILIFPIDLGPVTALVVALGTFVSACVTAEPYRVKTTKEILKDLIIISSPILGALSLFKMAYVMRNLSKPDIATAILVICQLGWGIALVAFGAYEAYLLYNFLHDS